MKIVSQFSDYYDHVEETYYSPGVLKVEFHRSTEHCSPAQIYRAREKLSQEKIDPIKSYNDKKENWSVTFFALGFCGRLHRGAQITIADVIEVSYTLSGAIYLPKKYGIEIPSDVQDNAEKHFDLWDDFCTDACNEIDSPSFVILPGSFQNIQIIKNPVLSNWHFQKAMNSYNAFHKTKMFLLDQQEKKSKKKQRSSSIWHFNPFISAFLTVN